MELRVGAAEPRLYLDQACICGHQGRKHYSGQSQHPFTCSLCSCMYFEIPPMAEERPLYEQLADAIRCTTHIEDRLLRARYILTDLALRGLVIQHVRRDVHGRFIR